MSNLYLQVINGSASATFGTANPGLCLSGLASDRWRHGRLSFATAFYTTPHRTPHLNCCEDRHTWEGYIDQTKPFTHKGFLGLAGVVGL